MVNAQVLEELLTRIKEGEAAVAAVDGGRQWRTWQAEIHLLRRASDAETAELMFWAYSRFEMAGETTVRDALIKVAASHYIDPRSADTHALVELASLRDKYVAV